MKILITILVFLLLLVLAAVIVALCATCRWSIYTCPDDTMVYLYAPWWLGGAEIGVNPVGMEYLPSTVRLLLSTGRGYNMLGLSILGEDIIV